MKKILFVWIEIQELSMNTLVCLTPELDLCSRQSTFPLTIINGNYDENFALKNCQNHIIESIFFCHNFFFCKSLRMNKLILVNVMHKNCTWNLHCCVQVLYIFAIIHAVLLTNWYFLNHLFEFFLEVGNKCIGMFGIVWFAYWLADYGHMYFESYRIFFEKCEFKNKICII